MFEKRESGCCSWACSRKDAAMAVGQCAFALLGKHGGMGLLGKDRGEIPLRSRDLVLRLRLGEGMGADAVGLWGAASHDGLRMTALLGGCAPVSGRLRGAPPAVGYSG